ncbi:MAG: YdcF family protein [Erysipelotrichaceae bacterium]|nr:YdcF family protein [Erysipelotrichaceae bacterium]
MMFVFLLIGTIGLFLFLLPLILYGTLSIGNATGIFVSILMLLIGLFYQQIKEYSQTKKGKSIMKIIMIMVLLIISLVTVETGLMVHGAMPRHNAKGTVVVLGCLVRGTTPSMSLRERLDTAYDYLNDHPETSCIVSGGQGDRENISEAECMYRYLIARGIDASRLYKEDQSINTRENLAFSLEVIKEHHLDEHLLIVTNNFHEYRANHIAKRLNLSSSPLPAPTHWTLLPTHYVRELYSILYEWIR